MNSFLLLGVVYKLRLQDVVGRWSKNVQFLSMFIPQKLSMQGGRWSKKAKFLSTQFVNNQGTKKSFRNYLTFNGQQKSILDRSLSNTLDLPQPPSNEGHDLTVAMAAALLLQVTMLTKDLSLTKHPRLKHLFLMPAYQPCL